MTKTEILLYGTLLESDMYTDGYGSTDEDTELLQRALKKTYGVTEGALQDVLLKAEEQMKSDLINLVIEFRGKIVEYLGKEEV